MIFAHFDKHFKRVGTSMDAHTLMMIRGMVLLFIIIFPIYPLVFLYIYLKEEYEFKEWPTIAKVICYIVLFFWLILAYGILFPGGEAPGPFDNLPSWSYRDPETGVWHTEYKGIDY